MAEKADIDNSDQRASGRPDTDRAKRFLDLWEASLAKVIRGSSVPPANGTEVK